MDPLIGHLRVIPQEKTADTLKEWSKKYGDVMYLEALGRKMVVLGSVEAAQALLENRGANYSCRPKFTLYEIMGWDTVTLLQYGKRFLKQRKMLQQYFALKECRSYSHIIAEEARHLIKNLGNAAPGTQRGYLQRHIRSDDDDFMKLAHDISTSMNASGPPGNTPIDLFPWLRHMPSWFPGTYYMSVAKSEYKTIRRLFDFPVDFVKARMKTQNYEKCFVSSKLEELDGSDDTNEMAEIKSASAAIFSGGEDTSYASLSYFCLAMLLHPECQQRAYDEITSVVGPNTLPDLHDRESLPYVEAVVQEVLRWGVVAPLGVPHRAMEDDIYEGMFIPKDSMVTANLRGMSRDEKVYKNPDAFDPTRFLPQPQGRGEPHFTAAFGFGRRICPGRHFANLVLWHSITCILAALELVPEKDLGGHPKMPKLEFTDGLVWWVIYDESLIHGGGD
ncbi:hypothetical protein V5O48_001328 [Marasmius crinis-equi]|uniref:Cytochrome P450 n=1 Tax=Marasmius crinis-equi TaxID=585013 RepID=A0ABR3FYQ7_9AGAR